MTNEKKTHRRLFSGSPPCWQPPVTIEEHRPLIFLNLDPVNMNTANDTAGLKATLAEENKNDMFRLPLLHHASDEVNHCRSFLFFVFLFFFFLVLGPSRRTMGSIDSRSIRNVNKFI